MEAVVSLLFTIAAVIFIFFLAWFVTRLVASRGNISGQGRYVAVVEKIPVSKDSYIMLVKSFDRILVVGATPQGMTTLREFAAERLEEEEPLPQPETFTQVLKNTLDAALPDGRVKEGIDRLLQKVGPGSRQQPGVSEANQGTPTE